ncbi:MAG: nicotinamide-nucleotide adenylyltransferase [Candidatus Levybacteria bacterium]|nr:nicotinamide-nucleotide adenylyltransferase [Candidatus Levybacteria bacterium]
MEHFKKGLLVGRFQPFHNGHLYLIKKAFTFVDALIIGIGSVNTHDKNNPLSYEDRETLMRQVITREKLDGKKIHIVPLRDYFNDELWLKHALATVPLFDVVIGNNEWTNGIFQKAGYTVIRIPYYKRYIYEGERIRKIMERRGKWESRVPSYLVPFIQEKMLL